MRSKLYWLVFLALVAVLLSLFFGRADTSIEPEQESKLEQKTVETVERLAKPDTMQALRANNQRLALNKSERKQGNTTAPTSLEAVKELSGALQVLDRAALGMDEKVLSAFKEMPSDCDWCEDFFAELRKRMDSPRYDEGQKSFFLQILVEHQQLDEAYLKEVMAGENVSAYQQKLHDDMVAGDELAARLEQSAEASGTRTLEDAEFSEDELPYLIKLIDEDDSQKGVAIEKLVSNPSGQGLASLARYCDQKESVCRANRKLIFKAVNKLDLKQQEDFATQNKGMYTSKFVDTLIADMEENASTREPPGKTPKEIEMPQPEDF